MSIGEIDNVNFGLRRGMLMNEPTYPFALRQDKKRLTKKAKYAKIWMFGNAFDDSSRQCDFKGGTE